MEMSLSSAPWPSAPCTRWVCCPLSLASWSPYTERKSVHIFQVLRSENSPVFAFLILSGMEIKKIEKVRPCVILFIFNLQNRQPIEQKAVAKTWREEKMEVTAGGWFHIFWALWPVVREMVISPKNTVCSMTLCLSLSDAFMCHYWQSLQKDFLRKLSAEVSLEWISIVYTLNLPLVSLDLLIVNYFT